MSIIPEKPASLLWVRYKPCWNLTKRKKAYYTDLPAQINTAGGEVEKNQLFAQQHKIGQLLEQGYRVSVSPCAGEADLLSRVDDYSSQINVSVRNVAMPRAQRHLALCVQASRGADMSHTDPLKAFVLPPESKPVAEHIQQDLKMKSDPFHLEAIRSFFEDEPATNIYSKERFGSESYVQPRRLCRIRTTRQIVNRTRSLLLASQSPLDPDTEHRSLGELSIY